MFRVSSETCTATSQICKSVIEAKSNTQSEGISNNNNYTTCDLRGVKWFYRWNRSNNPNPFSCNAIYSNWGNKHVNNSQSWMFLFHTKCQGVHENLSWFGGQECLLKPAVWKDAAPVKMPKWFFPPSLHQYIHHLPWLQHPSSDVSLGDNCRQGSTIISASN